MLKTRTLSALCLSVLAAVFLNVEHIPVWAMFLSVLIMAWRFLIFNGRLPMPHSLVKAGLVAAGFYGVFYSYGAQLSIEAMMTLLIAGVSLKPMEIQKVNDSYQLVFLCFLLQGMHFLFDQTPFHFFMVLTCFVITIYALLAVNQNEVIGGWSAKRNGRLAVKIFFLSLPLTVFLFFILPRLGPLWSLNISTKSGVVGLSETMSPGDISQLGRRKELAFRVTFESDVPDMGERYWRALILDHYDGEKWSRRFSPDIDWRKASAIEAKYRYEVIMQPHEKKWLFSLANSQSSTIGVGVVEDGTLISRRKVNGLTQYEVQSLGGVWLNGRLSAKAKAAYLQLPQRLNLRTQAFAQQLSDQSDSLPDLLLKLQSYFWNSEYFYTLRPGVLDSSSRVDEFLFESRKGFCAHYAGALVFMLRSLGYPSRVVAGYLGGELNPVANYYSVYQYDAHAWVEVWVEGKGWLRVDPTSWVSPERVEQGMESAVQEEFAGFRSESEWIRAMRDRFQALNYYWQDWMLSYKGDTQQKLLSAIWGKRSPLEMFAIILFGFVLTVGVIFLVFFWGAFEKKTRIQSLNVYWIKRLQKKGVAVSHSDTLDTLVSESMNMSPAMRKKVMALGSHLENILFQQKQFQLGLLDAIKLRYIIWSITR